VINPRVFESEFKATFHIFSPVTIPSTVTKSMGLPADAPLSWFLHRHLPTSAPGAIRAVYRDSVIWTIYRDTKLIAFIGTVQKHMPTPTQTAT
jgi:hypothetical protein